MEFSLTIVSDLDTVLDNTRGILWTIFFNRLFGPITPKNDYFLGVPYPKVVGATALEDLINSEATSMVKSLTDSPLSQDAAVFKSSIAIKFYERDRHAVCWETWTLRVNVINNRRYPAAPGERHDLDAYREVFENNLMEICDVVDAHKSHIPAITSMETSPFPYRILRQDSSGNSGTASVEYVATTDAGDVIVQSAAANTGVYGEEILRNGYNFIKKMLSE
ncbi:unnamed protein product [Kuraishia capsulata CBS 1993]|uniref:Autophagy-related protein 101 n=1 Tax=Kuraishia capsulata CBS 1993 TaxID=1382522 RepID=W6MID4_9ASCO|nr:uncharacterized protein KUCA_T00001877001 [Kuraishia capsulata CBS 1993]CDK25906.1 unnamed protein product [Kuraishia capsulata CBS 1993]